MKRSHPNARIKKVALLAATLLLGILSNTFYGQELRQLPLSISSNAPYPHSDLIASLQLDWRTHQRYALGSDNFQLTWADDGHQYGAWGDGGGFGGSNSDGRVALGVARIEGGPREYRGVNVWGGVRSANPATFDGKSWGMICVDGTLYMWVVPDMPDGKNYRNHYAYIELARSTDHAASWTKYAWRFLQSEGLSIPTFLNFGRDYTGVPATYHDYVYSYFIHPQSPTIEHQGPHGVGLIVHKPGILFLARVSVDALSAKKELQKADFEFYSGLNAERQPIWGSNTSKQPVFQDANGVGWCVSASFHPGFQRIILCTEHGHSSQGQLGIFEAPAPWGPWSTIEYFQPARSFGWERSGSSLPWTNNVFFASLPTKWIDDDTFTLVFTGAGGGKDNDSMNTVRGSFLINE